MLLGHLADNKSGQVVTPQRGQLMLCWEGGDATAFSGCCRYTTLIIVVTRWFEPNRLRRCLTEMGVHARGHPRF
jgi:hypothetical protein